MCIFRVCRQVYWFIDTYLLEPIFLSFAFFIIFTHIQDVFNTQGEISITNFWGQLKMDISNYPWVYVPFLLVFLWWLVSRVLKSRRDNDIQRRIEANGIEMTKLIERNTQALEINNNVVQALEANTKILARVAGLLDKINKDRPNG